MEYSTSLPSLPSGVPTDYAKIKGCKGTSFHFMQLIFYKILDRKVFLNSQLPFEPN